MICGKLSNKKENIKVNTFVGFRTDKNTRKIKFVRRKTRKMKKKKIRDTPEIVIPKGYGIDDLLDFDDEGYENGEPVLVEEVKVTFERE